MREEAERGFAARDCYALPATAARYERDKFGSSFGQALKTREIDLFLSSLPEKAKVLDVGSGTGKLLIPLLESARYAVGADSSASMLRQAEARCLERGLSPTMVACDACSLPFKDGSFDCVVSSRLLMHLAGWREAIAEFCRVARASVTLDFPPLFGLTLLAPALGRAKRLLGGNRPPAYRVFSLKQVKRELEKHGFKVVSQERSYFVPIFVHRILDNPRLSELLEALPRRIGLTKLLGAPVTLKAVRVKALNA